MDDGLFMQVLFLPFIIIFALYVAFIGVDGKQSPTAAEGQNNGEENGSPSESETTESSPQP